MSGKYYVVDVHDGKGYYLTKIPKFKLMLLKGPYVSFSAAQKAADKLNKKRS